MDYGFFVADRLAERFCFGERSLFFCVVDPGRTP
jgi:hypothetical protein